MKLHIVLQLAIRPATIPQITYTPKKFPHGPLTQCATPSGSPQSLGHIRRAPLQAVYALRPSANKIAPCDSSPKSPTPTSPTPSAVSSAAPDTALPPQPAAHRSKARGSAAQSHTHAATR